MDELKEQIALMNGEHLLRAVCLMADEFPKKTENTMKVFLEIALSKESDLSFVELVDKLGVTNPTVSRCAYQLKYKEYALIYRPRINHPRSLNCKLTDKGKAFFEKIMELKDEN